MSCMSCQTISYDILYYVIKIIPFLSILVQLFSTKNVYILNNLSDSQYKWGSALLGMSRRSFCSTLSESMCLVNCLPITSESNQVNHKYLRSLNSQITVNNGNRSQIHVIICNLRNAGSPYSAYSSVFTTSISNAFRSITPISINRSRIIPYFTDSEALKNWTKSGSCVRRMGYHWKWLSYNSWVRIQDIFI